MKTIRDRLERLEARMPANRTPTLRFGRLKPLPPDYVGERHIVIVKRLTGSGDWNLYEFEERPGPAPPGSEDYTSTIFVTEAEMNL